MDIQKYAISPETSVRMAIEKIEQTGKKVVFVLDDRQKLLGLFSDGDMRKYILENGDLNAPVSHAMNPKPVVYASFAELENEVKHVRRVVYPLLDADGKLIDAFFWNDIGSGKPISCSLKHVPVVIMAGGKGTRLRPYTDILPKALVPIDGITITERIIQQFLDYECTDIYMILNHKKSMIKAYFNELEHPYHLEYLEESKPLGTGGGLSLLKQKVKDSFFVSNCDILIDTDYGYLYRYHKEKKNLITVVCAMKNIMMPYGVIVLGEDEQIKTIQEKPTQSFLTNTGLYLIEPDALKFIRENEEVDITNIIMRLIHQGEKVGVYPVSEKCWKDMGQINEMENMIRELEKQ